AYRTLQVGSVGINGSTGTVLGRTLMRLRDFADSALSDVRIHANQQRRERVLVTAFLSEIVLAAGLQAESRGMQFTVEAVDPGWIIEADPQLLATAVTNLVNNAFQYSDAGGQVTLRARDENGRLLIKVEDQCGGLPAFTADPFKPFGDRRGRDRTGLGLGLSIARQAVKAHGGDIEIHNRPGQGCTFAVAVPLASGAVPLSLGAT
ncbi:MAG: HAMP domain-containing sensor histidine kinase, partial [Gammaproteobacteria bacterium]